MSDSRSFPSPLASPFRLHLPASMPRPLRQQARPCLLPSHVATVLLPLNSRKLHSLLLLHPPLPLHLGLVAGQRLAESRSPGLLVVPETQARVCASCP